jgi:hypothetical protein
MHHDQRLTFDGEQVGFVESADGSELVPAAHFDEAALLAALNETAPPIFTEPQRQAALWLSRLLDSFILSRPFTPQAISLRVVAVAYTLQSERVKGRSLHQLAASLGCTRQAISRLLAQVEGELGHCPLRKKASTRAVYREAARRGWQKRKKTPPAGDQAGAAAMTTTAHTNPGVVNEAGASATADDRKR